MSMDRLETSSVAGVPRDVPFAELMSTFAKIGVLSFGGPAGQIAMMHRMLVDEKGWIDEKRYLHALNYCMLLPGPEAIQLATYVGWMLHGVRGGIVAGLLFVLPGALVVGLLSILYVLYRDVGGVDAVLLGIKAAVLAIVAQALFRIAQRALKGRIALGFAGLAFVALFVFAVPFPVVVILAALAGAVLMQTRDDQTDETQTRAVDADPPQGGGAMVGEAVRTIAIWGSLWFLPVALLVLTLGAGHVFVTLALFFAKLAVVTFGGAYAVLAYMAQAAVETHGWLQPGEMVDGLGLAETTPGPLILVTQFVGFLAGHRFADPFDPITAGIIAAALTTWMTFVPCFLWIFLGAPHVERLRGLRVLDAALSGITAAVVGVIANLALWFAIQVVFTETRSIGFGAGTVLMPQWGSLDVSAVLLTALAAVLVFALGRGPLIVVPAMALAGLAIAVVL
jgi:chromate transporter